VLISLVALGPSDALLYAGQASKGVTACTLFTAAEIRRVTATKPSPIDGIQSDESPLSGGGSECDVAGFGIQLDAVPVARFDANRQAFSSRANNTNACPTSPMKRISTTRAPAPVSR